VDDGKNHDTLGLNAIHDAVVLEQQLAYVRVICTRRPRFGRLVSVSTASKMRPTKRLA
jgi:hypothetical protein